MRVATLVKKVMMNNKYSIVPIVFLYLYIGKTKKIFYEKIYFTAGSGQFFWWNFGPKQHGVWQDLFGFRGVDRANNR